MSFISPIIFFFCLYQVFIIFWFWIIGDGYRQALVYYGGDVLDCCCGEDPVHCSLLLEEMDWNTLKLEDHLWYKVSL